MFGLLMAESRVGSTAQAAASNGCDQIHIVNQNRAGAPNGTPALCFVSDSIIVYACSDLSEQAEHSENCADDQYDLRFFEQILLFLVA